VWVVRRSISFSDLPDEEVVEEVVEEEVAEELEEEVEGMSVMR